MKARTKPRMFISPCLSVRDTWNQIVGLFFTFQFARKHSVDTWIHFRGVLWIIIQSQYQSTSDSACRPSSQMYSLKIHNRDGSVCNTSFSERSDSFCCKYRSVSTTCKGSGLLTGVAKVSCRNWRHKVHIMILNKHTGKLLLLFSLRHNVRTVISGRTGGEGCPRGGPSHSSFCFSSPGSHSLPHWGHLEGS